MLGEGVERPDAGVLMDAFMRAVEGSEARQRVLVDNPAALHGF
jgi:predicted TIM-barrel fold metal-dependent hydrolase